MAMFHDPTAEQLRAWTDWVASRPECVRKIAERFNPWTLYRMKSGHRCFLQSFNENGTVTVGVTGEFNAVCIDRQVFGIDPDELVECDLPAPGEAVGTAMTQDQVIENIDEIRLKVRPDLWVRRADGSVVRRDTN